MGVFMGGGLISRKTLVLHMLHKNLVTNIICEHKYFRLTGGLHCDHMGFHGSFLEPLHTY